MTRKPTPSTFQSFNRSARWLGQTCYSQRKTTSSCDAQDGSLIGVEILAARDFLGKEDPSTSTVKISGGDGCWVLTFGDKTGELGAPTDDGAPLAISSQDHAWTATLERNQTGQLLRLTLKNRA